MEVLREEGLDTVRYVLWDASSPTAVVLIDPGRATLSIPINSCESSICAPLLDQSA